MSDRLKAWRRMLSNVQDEECDGSFLFKEWYLTVEHQTRYLRMFKDDPVFREYIKVDMTNDLDKYLKQRAYAVTNMVNIVTGQAGCGKSNFLRALTHRFMGFQKEALEGSEDAKNLPSKPDYCFGPAQLLDTIADMPPCHTAFCDEWEDMLGEDSKNGLAKLDNLMTHMRFKRKTVGLCTPLGVRLVTTTSIFEPFGFNKKSVILETAIMLSKNRSYDFSQSKLLELYGKGIKPEAFTKIKRYRSKLLRDIPESEPDRIKKVDMEMRKRFLLPEDQKTRALWYTIDPHTGKEIMQGIVILTIGTELMEDDGYDQAKDENYQTLERNKGGVSAESKGKKTRLEEIAKNLYDFAKKTYNYPKNPREPEKINLKMYLTDYRAETGDDCVMSGKDWEEVQSRVVHFANEDYRKSQTLQQTNNIQSSIQQSVQNTNTSNEPMNEFTYDQDKVFEEVKKATKSNRIDRNIEIYKKLQRDPNYSQENVIKEYPDLKTRNSVSVALKPLKGAMDNIIGHFYEDYIFPYFQKIFANATKLRGEGESDFICIDRKGRTYYISVKCLDFATTYPLLYAEHHAEITDAREYFKKFNVMPRVIAFVYNRYNKRVYTRSIPEVVLKATYPLNNDMKDVLRLEDFDKDNVLESLITN